MEKYNAGSRKVTRLSAKYLSCISPMFYEVSGMGDEVRTKIRHICEAIDGGNVADKISFLKKARTALGRMKGISSSSTESKPISYTYFDNGRPREPSNPPSDQTWPLHAAAEYGDLEKVKTLIGQGHQVNELGQKNETPICLAAVTGDPDMIDYLLDEGADVKSKDCNNRTVLHYLTDHPKKMYKHDVYDVTEKLVESGAEVLSVDHRGHIPMWYAVLNGFADCFEFMFESIDISKLAEDPPSDLRAKGLVKILDWTLKSSIKTSRDAIFDTMEEAGSVTWRAFYRACEGSNERTTDMNITNATVDGMPLMTYVTNKRMESLALELLKRFPRLASAKDKNNENCLFPAVREQNLDRIYSFMKMRAEDMKPLFDASVRNYDNKSCIDIAQELGNQDVLMALHVTGPPPETSRDTWLRSWYDNERDVIKVIHNFNLTKREDRAFTFAPMVQVGEEEYMRMMAKDVYNLDYPDHRGLAVIIYNITFDEEATREGTQIDVQRLSRLFCSMGFGVLIRKNLRAAEMKEEINNITILPSIGEHQVFLLVVMSHGGKGYVMGVDGEPLYIDEEIVTPFDGNHCPRMRGIPKIFMIQACRGALTDGPEDMMIDASSTYNAWIGPSRLHPKADIFIIHSTYEEYAAVREESHGSWFLEEFILTAELYSHRDHLEDIVRKANCLLTRRLESDGTQVAESRSSLRKKLYLVRVDNEEVLQAKLDQLRIVWEHLVQS